MCAAIRLLNLDDNDTIRYSRNRILSRAGFCVEDAATGGEAWDKLQCGGYHLALLDVKLPDMSGLDLTRRIRSDRSNDAIRIVQISAVCISEADEMAALENGADFYVRHPFDTEDLPALLTRIAVTDRAELRSRPRGEDVPEPADASTVRRDLHVAYAEFMSVAAELRALRDELTAEDDPARAASLRQRYDALQPAWGRSFQNYSLKYRAFLATLPSYPGSFGKVRS
jgi:DNA-binding response OmpR family regulator